MARVRARAREGRLSRVSRARARAREGHLSSILRMVQ